MSRRVVVTGIGLVSSVGIGTGANWDALLAGRSGIGRITRFDVTQFATQIAGEVKDFDPQQFVEKKDVKKMDIFIQYAIAASQFAMDDSGLVVTPGHRRSHRGVHRLGHRRFLDHRTGAPGAARGRASQDLALLHPLGDHQSRLGPGVDPLRRQGPQLGDLHGLLGLGTRDRRRVRDDQTRRRRRDDRGRIGSGHHAHGGRRVWRHAGAVDPQRRPAPGQPAV